MKLRSNENLAFLLGLGLVGLAASACSEQTAPVLERQTLALTGSADIVISQVYGAGGNTNAQYHNDFIELFNRGTSTVSINGWSVQYASATGSSWSKTNLAGTIQPGQHYLVQEAAGTGGGASLPTPDATGTISMSATSAKVALVINQTLLTCSTGCLPNSNIRDFVGYGSSANSYEGSGPTPTLSNTTAAMRAANGCTDTDNNSADFTAVAPNPRNTASTYTTCGGGGTGGSSGTGGSVGTGGSIGTGGSVGTGGSSGTCSHDMCVTGSKLVSGCNACVTSICASDPYCCNTSWDSQCVGEVASICGQSCTGTGGSIGTGGSVGTGGATGTGGSGGSVTLPSPTLPPVTLSTLTFGVLGDTRPSSSTSGHYPTTLQNIINGIFTGLNGKGVQFAISVGDFCYSGSGSGAGVPQFNDFMSARALLSAPFLPVLGNHECNTNTNGNCPAGSYTGLMQDYVNTIVTPSTNQSLPYYSILYKATDGSWNAKFIVTAANAWDTTQQTWLQSTLAVKTTYTFFLRHEPASANTAPGTTPSENLVSAAYNAGNLTLSMTGHTHLVQLPGGTLPYGDPYGATQAYEIIVGNGGAPLDAGSYYGYAVLTRRASDGAIVTQMYESANSSGTAISPNVADTNFRFAVNSNGSSNPNTQLP